jgi:hypothetical protein
MNAVALPSALMPDPHVVYVVTAVVVLALVVWVVVVLVRPASEPQASLAGTPAKPANPPPAEEEKPRAQHATSPESREALLRSRPRLDSHLEIQDQDDEGGADGKS